MKLFFDFDGTLVDVAPRHYRVYAETVESFGGTPLPQEEYWDLKRRKTKWPALLRMSKLDANIEPQFLDWFIDKIESPDYLRSDQLFSGAKELLADLASRHELYLVSLRRHPERLNEQLQGLAVKQYFTAILSGHSESDGSDVKTSLIQAKLGGEDGLIVGDTEADILTGKALGLTTVAVTTGIRDEQFLRALEPNYVIESIQELVVITKN